MKRIVASILVLSITTLTGCAQMEAQRIQQQSADETARWNAQMNWEAIDHEATLAGIRCWDIKPYNIQVIDQCRANIQRKRDTLLAQQPQFIQDKVREDERLRQPTVNRFDGQRDNLAGAVQQDPTAAAIDRNTSAIEAQTRQMQQNAIWGH